MADDRDRHDGRTSPWGPASSQYDSPPPPVAPRHQPGASPLITDTGVGASLRRRRGGLPLWTWIVGAIAVIGGAIGLALTVDPESDTASDTALPAEPTTAATNPPDDVAPDATAGAPTTAETAAPETTAAPTETLAVGDEFTFEDRDGVTWDVSIAGLVEAPSEEGGDGCLLAVGVLTPTATDGAVSSAFSTPTIGLQFGDEILDDSVNDCDTAVVEAAGYGWILDAVVTAGTPYPFFTEFRLTDPEQRPDAIRAGDLFDDSAVALAPTVLTDVPEIPSTEGVRADVARQPMGDGPEASTVYHDPDGVRWDVSVTALVDVPTRDPENARCLLGLGIMTPTGIDGALSDPFTTPPFALVADGRLVNSTAIECETESAVAAGYGWRLDAAVADATPYPFYVEFLLPADADLVDLMIVGLPSAADAAFYEPTILDEVPAIG